jgi:pimeloyl-ACP methyl ester carboxylesterase
VRASRNASSWPPDRVAELERACGGGGRAAAVHLLRDAGHNVHMDAPAELLALMEARLSA